MERNKAILLILIIVFATTSIITITHFFYTTVATTDYPIFLIVGKSMGIDVGTDKLRFGRIVPGGGSTRQMTILNDYPMIVRADLSVIGELKGRVSFSENHFILNPNAKKTVDVSVGMPEDASFGNYTSTLRVILKRQ